MTLLRNVTAVTLNERREIVDDAAIKIVGSTILSIGKASEYPSSEDDLDCNGLIAIPGLIDTHSHADQSLLRGLGDQMHWLPFLEKIVDPYLTRRSQSLSILANQLSMVEMLKGGTTSFVSPNTDPSDNIDALIDAATSIGIRATFCRFTTADDNWPKTRSLIKGWQSNKGSLANIWLGVDIPRVSGDISHPEFYQRVKRESEHLDIGLVYHFCSEYEDAAFMVNEFNQTPGEWSLSNSLLGPNVILINGCQVTAREIEILAETGTHLSHSPVANMKMATGVLPAADLLHAGINLGLGTDGALNNNSYDMFLEMKCACLLQNSLKRTPRALLPEQALEMATINGAKALGRDDLGSLEPGKKADVVLLDFNAPRTQPIHDLVSNIVFSASASQVRHVFVDGRHVVDDFNIQGISERQLITAAQAETEEIRNLIGAHPASRWPRI